MSNEANIYMCVWVKDGRRIRGRCPLLNLEVLAPDVGAVRELLASRITEATGDGEPFVELRPYKDEVRHSEAGYRRLAWHQAVEWACVDGNLSSLYTGGVCAGCGIGLGVRSHVPRVVRSVPKSDCVGFYKDRSLGFLVSENLCEVLVEEGGGKLTPVEVMIAESIAGSCKKRFFELSFHAEYHSVVPLDGIVDYNWSWACNDCQRKSVFWTSRTIGSSRLCLPDRKDKGCVLTICNGPWLTLGFASQLIAGAGAKRRSVTVATEPIVFLREGMFLAT